MVMKYRDGTTTLITWIHFGMVSIENTNPGKQETRQKGGQHAHLIGHHLRLAAGRNENAPEHGAAQKHQGGNAPAPAGCRGTALRRRPFPTTNEITASTSPTTKYASILPSTISAGRSGVERICSMVPISHSRAMVRVVNWPVRIIRIIAIRPGTTKFLDCERAVVPHAHLRRHHGRRRA